MEDQEEEENAEEREEFHLRKEMMVWNGMEVE